MLIILSIFSLFLITAGAVMSVLRSRATIEYMRTLIKDGRDAPHAKTQMIFYNIGKFMMISGILLLMYSVYAMLME